MKRSISALATAVLLVSAGAARAQISYSYLHASGVDSEADTALGELEGLGGEIGASLDVLPRMHVFADYRNVELDDFAYETETIRAGVGFHSDVADMGSVFVDASYLTRDISAGSGVMASSFDEDGYGVSVGYRETNDKRLEFLARLDYVEFQDTNYSDTSLFTSLQFRATQRLHVETGINFAGDDTYWKLGVRYYLPSWIRRGEQ